MEASAIVDFLVATHNLPFTLSLMLASTFSALQVFFGVLPDGIDLDGDLEAELDLDGDIDADGTFAHDLGVRLLGWMGVGKIPLSVLATMFLFIFGIGGLSLTSGFHAAFEIPRLGALNGAVWIVIWFAVSLRITGLLSTQVSRILPKNSTTAIGGAGDVSKTCIAATDMDEVGGQIDMGGGRYAFGMLAPGALPVRKGQRLMIVSYTDATNTYIVEPL